MLSTNYYKGEQAMTLLRNIGKLLILLVQILYYSISIKINKLTHNINDTTLKLYLRYKHDKIAKINSEQQESKKVTKTKIDYHEEQLGI